MSTRYLAALVAPPTLELVPSSVDQDSTATATLTSKAISAKPIRHYVWVYDLSGTKVDVLA